MRDMNNKLTRDEIDILDTFHAFNNEHINKVLIKDGRMWVVTEHVYVY